MGIFYNNDYNNYINESSNEIMYKFLYETECMVNEYNMINHIMLEADQDDKSKKEKFKNIVKSLVKKAIRTIEQLYTKICKVLRNCFDSEYRFVKKYQRALEEYCKDEKFEITEYAGIKTTANKDVLYYIDDVEDKFMYNKFCKDVYGINFDSLGDIENISDLKSCLNDFLDKKIVKKDSIIAVLYKFRDTGISIGKLINRDYKNMYIEQIKSLMDDDIIGKDCINALKDAMQCVVTMYDYQCKAAKQAKKDARLLLREVIKRAKENAKAQGIKVFSDEFFKDSDKQNAFFDED